MNEATQQIAINEGNPAQTKTTYSTKAYAAQSPTSGMAPVTIWRRVIRPQDVQINILYCGVCHSDLHQVRNQWQAMPTIYPCVPGHVIVGRVVKTGSAVKKFNKAMSLPSAAWWIPAVHALVAGPEKNNIATGFPRLPTTVKIDISAASLTEGIQRLSWWMRHLCCRLQTRRILPAPRHYYARASLRTRLCVTGKSARVIRSACRAWRIGPHGY